jgi:hypothetical protein
VWLEWSWFLGLTLLWLVCLVNKCIYTIRPWNLLMEKDIIWVVEKLVFNLGCGVGHPLEKEWCSYIYAFCIWKNQVIFACWLMYHGMVFFFFNLRKLHLLKSVFYGFRWASKISAVSNSYKRCTPWLELETCYADLKSFAITLYPLRTWNDYYVIYRKYYLFCVEKVVCAWKNYMHEIKVFMQLIT